MLNHPISTDRADAHPQPSAKPLTPLKANVPAIEIFDEGESKWIAVLMLRLN